jgi:AraC-like DNA-binding protein
MLPRTVDDELTQSIPLQGGILHHDRPKPLDMDIHQSFEIGVVLSGEIERHHEDFVMRLTAGGVWLNAAWEPHGWRILRADTNELVIKFIPDFLGDESLGSHSWLAPFAAAPSERPQVTTKEAGRDAIAIARDIERELALRPRAWVIAARLSVLRLLLTLSRDWKPHYVSSGQTPARTRNLSRIMPAIRLLESQPSRRVSLREAAGACGLSVSQFGALFRHTMGVSFARFCLRNRLGLVAKRLLHTRLPLEAIAAEFGFTHGSHLHRTFVKHYGCSPGQYRDRGQAASVGEVSAASEGARGAD